MDERTEDGQAVAESQEEEEEAHKKEESIFVSSFFFACGGKAHTGARWVVGIILLLVVVFIWVFSGVLMQYIFEDAHFDHPFFLTYFSTSLFMLYLFDFLTDVSFRQIEKEERRELIVNADDEADSEGNREIDLVTYKQPDGENVQKINDVVSAESKTFLASFLEIAKVSIIFCPVWFAANYSYNKSLSLTTVTSNTILSSTSSLGTLFLGSMLGVDSFSFGKLIAVILTYRNPLTKAFTWAHMLPFIPYSIGGVTIVALTDSKDSDKDSFAGDILCLIGAAFYALYVVLLKLMIKDENKFNTRRFLGLVGFFNVLLLWPFGLLLHFTGLETLALPTGYVWLYLTVNGLIGTVLSDLLWLWSVLLTSPLVATIGLSLTIPLAMLADIVLKDKNFGWFYLLGSTLVVSGFLLVNCDDLYLRFQRNVVAWLRRNLGRHHEVEIIGVEHNE